MSITRARLVFDHETGTLTFPTVRSTWRARVGSEYEGDTGSRVLLLGIIGDPADVQHVRVRSVGVERPRERVISADGFMRNYSVERFATTKPPKEKAKPQVPVTVDAIAMLDLHDTMKELLAAQRETNALLTQLVEKWK